MAEPENQTIHLLREIRGDVKSLEKKVDSGFEQVDKRFAQVDKRIDSLRQAMHGETVLGQYATAGIDDRLESIEKRLSDLEKRRS